MGPKISGPTKIWVKKKFLKCLVNIVYGPKNLGPRDFEYYKFWVKRFGFKKLK